MMRSNPWRVLGVLVCAWFALGAGSASAEHVRCGAVIAQDTKLDSDLRCTGDGVTVEGDVTFDLAGHTIEGVGRSVGVTVAGNGVTIKGGTVRGFDAAVWSDGQVGLLVTEATLERNGIAVDCDYSPGCSVTDSTVRSNTVGISLNAPDGGALVRSFVMGNRIHGNGTGISLTEYLVTVSRNHVQSNDVGVKIDYAARVTMTGNVVSANHGDGVRVTFMSRASITGNRIERNGGNGVYLEGDFFFGGSTRATASGNTVGRNGADGILATNAVGGNAFVIERNRTDRNGDDGVDVDAGEEATAELGGIDAVVATNRADFNADLGIEADPGTTDGGGNRAKHNGNPAQCVGVSCK